MVIKYDTKTGRITGQDIIDFITKNHLEDKAAYRTHENDGTVMRVYSLECDDDESSTTFVID